MPGMDKTGPLGQGPLTGRGLGPCGAGARAGLGFRRGLGRGMGRRMAFQQAQPVASMQPVVLTEAEEKKILKADLEDLEAEKADIEKRLKDLKD